MLVYWRLGVDRTHGSGTQVELLHVVKGYGDFLYAISFKNHCIEQHIPTLEHMNSVTKSVSGVS